MSSGNFLFCSVPPPVPYFSNTRIRNSLWGDFLALGKRILRNLTCPFFSPIQNAGTDAKLPIATGLPGLRPAPRQLCSTSQLFAATLALENASQIPVAPNGTRIPNSCLMAEAVMNDARHTFLMFAPDFVIWLTRTIRFMTQFSRLLSHRSKEDWPARPCIARSKFWE